MNKIFTELLVLMLTCIFVANLFTFHHYKYVIRQGDNVMTIHTKKKSLKL